MASLWLRLVTAMQKILTIGTKHIKLTTGMDSGPSDLGKTPFFLSSFLYLYLTRILTILISLRRTDIPPPYCQCSDEYEDLL